MALATALGIQGRIGPGTAIFNTQRGPSAVSEVGFSILIAIAQLEDSKVYCWLILLCAVIRSYGEGRVLFGYSVQGSPEYRHGLNNSQNSP